MKKSSDTKHNVNCYPGDTPNLKGVILIEIVRVCEMGYIMLISTYRS